jgi:hypothetical protein
LADELICWLCSCVLQQLRICAGKRRAWPLEAHRHAIRCTKGGSKAGSSTAASKSQSAQAVEHQGLCAGKVLVVLGKTDRAVFSDELELDAKAVLRPADLEVKVFDAEHEVPVTHAEEIGTLCDLEG